jgi:hypothetical protein
MREGRHSAVTPVLCVGWLADWLVLWLADWLDVLVLVLGRGDQGSQQCVLPDSQSLRGCCQVWQWWWCEVVSLVMSLLFCHIYCVV